MQLSGINIDVEVGQRWFGAVLDERSGAFSVELRPNDHRVVLHVPNNRLVEHKRSAGDADRKV